MLSVREIDELRSDVITLLRKVDAKKYSMRTHDKLSLRNHLQYSLTILDNMKNIRSVEMSDPYNAWMADSPSNTGYTSDKSIVYNSDGTTTIFNTGKLPGKTPDGWESQFDESQLIRPPCFVMPPQNLTSIPRIKQTKYDNISRLTKRNAR